MNDNIPWTSDLKQGRNGRIVTSCQRCYFYDYTVLVRFREEEDFIAPCLADGIAQKLRGRRRNEFVKV